MLILKKIKSIMCTAVAIVLVGGITLCGGISAQAKTQSGKVSWYNQVGGSTASGKTSPNGAAHKSIAFNTKVTVKNNKNGKTTKVIILDRGPYVKGRILDMNKSAFAKVENTSAGLFNGTITW